MINVNTLKKKESGRRVTCGCFFLEDLRSLFSLINLSAACPQGTPLACAAGRRANILMAKYNI